MRRAINHARKVAIGILGGLVLLLGLVAIPYPGPGWLIVLTGLAILATEFVWAQRVRDYVHAKYDAWVLWLKRQTLSVRIFFIAFTCMVVVITIWLLNGYGFLSDWFNLDLERVHSPLPIFDKDE